MPNLLQSNSAPPDAEQGVVFPDDADKGSLEKHFVVYAWLCRFQHTHLQIDRTVLQGVSKLICPGNKTQRTPYKARPCRWWWSRMAPAARFLGHVDTAIALADAGFVMAALTHTGDNYADRAAALTLRTGPVNSAG